MCAPSALRASSAPPRCRMRLAELNVMRDELGEWPVLMLDDVMSELDPGRSRQPALASI